MQQRILASILYADHSIRCERWLIRSPALPPASTRKHFNNRSYLTPFFDFIPAPPRAPVSASPGPYCDTVELPLALLGGKIIRPSSQTRQPYQWQGERWIRDQKGLFSPFFHTVRLYLLWVPVAQHNATHTNYTWQAFSFLGPGGDAAVLAVIETFPPNMFKGTPETHIWF